MRYPEFTDGPTAKRRESWQAFCSVLADRTKALQAGRRRVPLSAAAMQLVEMWQRHTDGDPDALVFGTRSGKPISPNNVLRRIAAAAGELGLPKVSWLTFRRTYSSWAHDKSVPGKIVATLMGHAKVDTTLNVYTQVLDGSVRAAAETVGDELFTIVHKTGVLPVENGVGAR